MCDDLGENLQAMKMKGCQTLALLFLDHLLILSLPVHLPFPSSLNAWYNITWNNYSHELKNNSKAPSARTPLEITNERIVKIRTDGGAGLPTEDNLDATSIPPISPTASALITRSLEHVHGIVIPHWCRRMQMREAVLCRRRCIEGNIPHMFS